MPDVPLEQNRAFGGVIDILAALGIEYLIWGGVAVALYGEPRFTRDMDIVVRLPYDQVEPLGRLLEEDGYYVSVEAIREAVERNFYFNTIHLETGIKIDFLVAGDDPLLAWAFEHSWKVAFDEFRQAVYMPPESVILAKLRALKESRAERHRLDVEGILRVSGEGLNLAYIGRQANRMGLYDLWHELLDRWRG
jgi:hypothetical protein